MIRTAARRACRGWAAASLKAHSTTTPVSTAVPRPATSPAYLSKVMTSSIKPGQVEELRWRFPADDKMINMVSQVENGLGQTATVTLNAVKPITHDLMEEALFHLYDKMESLRLCFQPRDGQLWVTDMPRRKLDFQLVSGSDLDEQHDLLRDSPFNLQDGPLWKARLMPCPEDAPCQFPEVKTAFPHQCHLILSVHHATNDGMVVMMMMQMLIDIIDSLLQGVPVNTKQVGEFRDGIEAREEEARIRTALQNNPERLVAALRRHVGNNHFPLLMEAFGLPKVANPTTKNLPPVLIDNQLMDKFANQCRSLGVTINAAFTALFNVSLMEMVREAGLEKDVYNILSRHPVDCRRLIKNFQHIPLGNHAHAFTQSTATLPDVKKHFWQYVKHLDIELREKIKSNYMCEEKLLELMMRPEGYTHEAHCALRKLPSFDYMFSNLYSPRSSYQGSGKYVQSTFSGNYMSFHNISFALGLGLFTLRGQARLQLAYSTAAVTKTVAQRYFEKSIVSFNDVARELD